jgi:CheY-like chemotaxis protein
MEYSILVVDDEKGIHKLLAVFLALNKQHMFSLHTALHGKVGVEMYSKLVDEGKKPDLVLMDIRMPVMDGVEATIRIMDYDPEANIYLFTAYAGTEVARNGRNAGAKGTISKDADWNITAEKIVDILESS